MKHRLKLRIHQFYVLLRDAMPVMIFLMLIFFGTAILGFQADNKRLLEDTRATVKNTEIIVEKQNEILDAIRQLSLDNRLTSKQLGDTIICMLLVPVQQRTEDTKVNCRNQAVYGTPTIEESVSYAEELAQPPANFTVPETAPKAPAEPAPTPMNPLESLLDIIGQPISDLFSVFRR